MNDAASGDYTCHVWRYPKPEEKKENKLKEEKQDSPLSKPWTPLLDRESYVLSNLVNVNNINSVLVLLINYRYQIQHLLLLLHNNKTLSKIILLQVSSYPQLLTSMIS